MQLKHTREDLPDLKQLTVSSSNTPKRDKVVDVASHERAVVVVSRIIAGNNQHRVR